LKLTGFFKSPNVAVRRFTWLMAFLLLTVLWILLLPLLSLNGVLQYFSNIGMTGAQSITAITLAPPLMLAVLSWIGIQMLAPPAAPALTPPAATPELSISAQSTPAAAALSPAEMLRIAAWSVLTPFGDTGATVAGSREKEKVFRSDSLIRNAEGHPVHTGTVEDMPLENLGYPPDTRSRAMRVSAMLVTVLNTLFDQQVELARSATAPATVYWLIPEALPLDDETRLNFSLAWAQSLWRGVDYDLHFLPAATESVYGAVNTLQRHVSASKMPFVLLLAADSLLNPDELLAPLALEQVFSNKAPEGFVPAEGAAGLLLVDAAFATASDLVGRCALGPVHREQRASDRGARRKVDSSTLVTCITEAIDTVQTTADKIGIVISDTDHRVQRSVEVAQAMEQTLPELDPLSDRINPMAFAGYFGAASDLIHMALAAEMVASTGQAALVVSVAHSLQTAAVVILPNARVSMAKSAMEKQ
jgi:hypothetical protein